MFVAVNLNRNSDSLCDFCQDGIFESTPTMMKWTISLRRLRPTSRTIYAMIGSIVLCSSSVAGELTNRERDRDLIRRGEELFHREWMPDDPRKSRWRRARTRLQRHFMRELP